MKKKKELYLEDLINLWMVKYHGITIQEAYEKDPWTDSRTFYERFQCTQEQHDLWNEEAKEVYRKHYKLSKYSLNRSWGFIYLNASPMVSNPVQLEEK